MAVTEERTESYVGSSITRREDAKLLTGQTRWTDNLTVPGMLWAVVVRSPYAHARITSVDTSTAREAEGVVAAFSGAELAEEWAGALPCAWPVTEDTKNPPHWPLAQDKARYVGDGVAVVIADSRALAKDAAELVEVNYEPLPSVTDVARARRRSTTSSTRTTATPGPCRTARSTASSPRPPSPSRSTTASSG